MGLMSGHNTFSGILTLGACERTDLGELYRQFTGTIGFIDLVSPHIIRMAICGDHRFLLPGSALVGALRLLGADTLARVVLAPVILPVGIMTSFLGVPFFVYLFLQRRRTF